MLRINPLIALLLTSAAYGQSGDSVMPAAEQNALIQKYCTVCHSDGHMNGRLSLQHFDAAHPDPGLAAMIVSKLRGGAFGASGIKPPGKPIEDALTRALTASSAGADEWILNRTDNARVVTASIVQQVPSIKKPSEPSVYRLTVTCNPTTRAGEMKLAWSPDVPPSGRQMHVALDGKPPIPYTVEGSETMANGVNASSGPGAALLYSTVEAPGTQKLAAPLAARTLTIANLFASESIAFPFDKLAKPVRDELSACFPGER